MKKLTLALILTALGSGCALFEDMFEDEQEVALAQVPAAVLSAARQAVPGIKLTAAEIEQEDGQSWYELDGTLDGVEYEIEIDKNGKVLSVEK